MHSKESVAIAELVLFVPLIFPVRFVAFRRQSIKQLQWILLPFFCLMRLISAALELTASRTNENLINDAERTTILDNIVLCLLLVTILQFLIGMYVLSPVFIVYTRVIYNTI